MFFKKGATIPSLCVLDFQNVTCWVSKPNNVGFPFIQMQDLQTTWMNGSGDDAWYAIKKKDLDKIQRTLNH